jgi:hypothetical protein
MRLVAVTLALALLSLAFAPAPFPKAERATPQQRELRECDTRLRALGVTWWLVTRDGSRCVQFQVRNVKDGSVDGLCGFCNVKGDVPGALRAVLTFLQSFKAERLSPPP